jgi:hypothetical protein
MHVVGPLVAGALLIAGHGHAEQPVVYPAKGQNPQQQATDDAECKAWAQQTTGVDPAAAPAAAAPPPPAAPAGPQGQRLRGAARGAAVGAVAGEIAHGDASHGAAVGAGAGVVAGGARARRERAAQQQAQAAQAAAATHSAEASRAAELDTFHRAYAACMQGRDYSVR